MAAKKKPRKNTPKNLFDLEALRLSFLEDPDNWQKYWEVWMMFQECLENDASIPGDAYPRSLRAQVARAALESLGTDPVVAAKDVNLYWHTAVTVLKNHPLLPIWMDGGDPAFVEMAHRFTARALVSNLNNASKSSVSNKNVAVSIVNELIMIIMGDSMDNVYRLHWEELAEFSMAGGHELIVARASDRICKECGLSPEIRFDHIYGHLLEPSL